MPVNFYAILGVWKDCNDDGYIGQFWTVMGPYMPKPPAYASPPAVTPPTPKAKDLQALPGGSGTKLS